MTIIKRDFLAKDFEKARDFLQDTYDQQSSNWTIERWSWSRFVDGYWLEIFETWPSTVGLWVDESDKIIAIVSNEGEINGNVFFQLKKSGHQEEFLHEMMDFAEQNLSIIKEGNKHLYPRINNICKDLFTKVLRDRGYTYSGNDETDATIEIEKKYTVELPKGFHIEATHRFKAEERALAHGKAFSKDFEGIQKYMKERTRAFTGLLLSPDYNKNLDLCVVDENNNIAAFAVFWFDKKNLVASLEPLGTAVEYTQMGLGKAVVYEGLNRLKEMGARKVHVGSNQVFYKKIGFEVDSKTEIWENKNLK